MKNSQETTYTNRLKKLSLKAFVAEYAAAMGHNYNGTEQQWKYPIC